MAKLQYIHLGIRLGLLIIGFTLFGFASFALVQAAGQPKTLDRDLEPLVLKGSQVSKLIGTPVNQLFIYVFATSNSTNPSLIPVQVDEVNGSGAYVASEDGLLDNNDEIVFMAKDSGSKANDPATVLDSKPIGTVWYEVEITDPLDQAKQGWIYLVSSNSLSTPSTDYAMYLSITETQRIIGTYTNDFNDFRYRIGFPPSSYGEHPGLDYLFLNGKLVDLLDRTKLRVEGTLFGVPQDLTENFFGVILPTLIKDGNVRVILTQQDSVPGIATLANLYKGYGAMVELIASVSSSITPSQARTSIDFTNTISGATFYNANTPGGVIVNGSPDSIAATPVSRWFQISHNTGRFIQITDPSPVGGTQNNFYLDNRNADDSPDSSTTNGVQSGSFGNSGFLFTGSINKSFALRTQFVALPASLTNVGATYESYYLNPLQVCFRENAAGDCLQNAPSENVFLPLIIK
jgi:hypothetical protein